MNIERVQPVAAGRLASAACRTSGCHVSHVTRRLGPCGCRADPACLSAGSGRRPTFQIPDIFSQGSPFPNLDDAFKPFFDFKPKLPAFPSFDFNPATFPSAGMTPCCWKYGNLL